MLATDITLREISPDRFTPSRETGPEWWKGDRDMTTADLEAFTQELEHAGAVTDPTDRAIALGMASARIHAAYNVALQRRNEAIAALHVHGGRTPVEIARLMSIGQPTDQRRVAHAISSIESPPKIRAAEKALVDRAERAQQLKALMSDAAAAADAAFADARTAPSADPGPIPDDPGAARAELATVRRDRDGAVTARNDLAISLIIHRGWPVTTTAAIAGSSASRYHERLSKNGLTAPVEDSPDLEQQFVDLIHRASQMAARYDALTAFVAATADDAGTAGTRGGGRAAEKDIARLTRYANAPARTRKPRLGLPRNRRALIEEVRRRLPEVVETLEAATRERNGIIRTLIEQRKLKGKLVFAAAGLTYSSAYYRRRNTIEAVPDGDDLIDRLPKAAAHVRDLTAERSALIAARNAALLHLRDVDRVRPIELAELSGLFASQIVQMKEDTGPDEA